MCGIAGFSLSQNSNIKVRKLANALLSVIEDRGGMASGYAWQHDEHMGFYKAPVSGSQLSLKGMPKDAKSVILHTRLATHGSIDDNRNNHPVISPSEDIALVHNGVIYNHHSVRRQIDATLPDVDTSVIPALIEQGGVSALDDLDGDAAIAWFDRKQHNTLHVARYQHSPLVLAQVEDGSFIFCSTEQLLWRVLIQLDLEPDWMYNVKELEYFTVRDGVIVSQESLPEPKQTNSWYDYGYYRHQTSGAKGIVSDWNESGIDYEDEDGVVRRLDAQYIVSSNYYDDSWEDDDFYDSDNYAGSVSVGDVREVATPEDDALYGYWTIIRDLEQNEFQTLRYFHSEKELWIDELYLLCDDDRIDVTDYGVIENREYVPIADNPMYDRLFD